jgi:threonine/homoserine/homoserine lactone efflux protein
MKTFLLLAAIYIMGFLSAIPVGPGQIEIAKRSLHDHLRAAIMVALGATFCDMLYGLIALFGVAPLFENKMAVAIFELCGAIIIWVLAYFTLRQGAQPHSLGLNRLILKSKRIALITGFSLSLANPMMIFWWLIGVQIVRHVDLVDTFTTPLSFAFVLFGGLGLATYLIAIAVALHWAKKFVSPRALQKIYVALGFLLILLSLYFLINSLRILLR